MNLSDKDYLITLADGLDKAHRLEGSNIIQMSDELAKVLSLRLRNIAENMGEVRNDEEIHSKSITNEERHGNG